jgi:hypothetical protein
MNDIEFNQNDISRLDAIVISITMNDDSIYHSINKSKFNLISTSIIVLQSHNLVLSHSSNIHGVLSNQSCLVTGGTGRDSSSSFSSSFSSLFSCSLSLSLFLSFSLSNNFVIIIISSVVF